MFCGHTWNKGTDMNKVVAVYFNQSTVKSSVVCAHILFHLTLITLSRPLLSFFFFFSCILFLLSIISWLFGLPSSSQSAVCASFNYQYHSFVSLPLNITVTNKCEQLPWKFHMTFVTINHELQQISFHATAFYSRKQLDVDWLPFIWNVALSCLL